MASISRIARGLARQVLRLGARPITGFRRRFKVRARQAEAAGDLVSATRHYLEAGLGDEAARVLELRAEAVTDVSMRQKLLAQALTHAADPRKLRLRKRNAQIKLEIVRTQQGSLLPVELTALGEELAELGEHQLAAEAYAYAGDIGRQARELVEAGDVEQLETLLEHDVTRTRSALAHKQLAKRLHDLDAVGQRRELLKTLKSYLTEPDAECQSLGRAVEARRIDGARVCMEIDGNLREFVFGSEVRIGRSDAEVIVHSPAVSRCHLVIRRTSGGVTASDLGSSNGTWYRGARLSAALAIVERTELLLGGEVPLELAPESGGVWITTAGTICFAPLGPLEVIDPATDAHWLIDRAEDSWLELDTRAKEAFLGGLRVSGRIELCRGDVFSVALGIPPKLRVMS